MRADKNKDMIRLIRLRDAARPVV